MNPGDETPTEPTGPIAPAPPTAPYSQPYGPPPVYPVQPYASPPAYAQQGYYASGPHLQPWTGGFGVQASTGLPYSDKSKTTAGLLQLLLPFIGICGVGRLYAGHTGIGLVQLLGVFVGYVLMIVLVGFLIVPALWLWTVIDGIMMLAGNPTDAQGRPLRP